MEGPPLITTSAGASSRHSNIKTQGRVCPAPQSRPGAPLRHCQLKCVTSGVYQARVQSLTPEICQVLDFYENKNRGHKECPGNFNQYCDKSHHQERPMVPVTTSASHLGLAAAISGNLSVPRGLKGLICFSLNVESNMTKMPVQRPSSITAPPTLNRGPPLALRSLCHPLSVPGSEDNCPVGWWQQASHFTW